MASRDEVAILIALIVLAKLPRLRGEPWWRPDRSDKGGRGAGPGATSLPVPQGTTTGWSRETMRLFAREMKYTAGIDPEVALLGVAAASNFNADEHLGNYCGLLMVNRVDLNDMGYPGVPPFEQIDAPSQIPWLAKVIAYQVASTGGTPPATVPDLAVLLHQSSNPTITDTIRNEAARRAKEAEGTMLYIHHRSLLRSVLTETL